MGLFENWPYTNFHNLNLDWVIKALKDLDKRVDNLQETITQAAKDYVDERIMEFVNGPMQDMQNQINQLTLDITSFEVSINQQFAGFKSEVNNQISDFENLVNAQIVLMKQQITDATAKFEQFVGMANDYTDQQIALVYERIADLIKIQTDDIKVLNFFTGEYVVIQDMFDYLSMLHVDNGLTYEEVEARNNTYTDIENIRATYYQITMNASILIVQK